LPWPATVKIDRSVNPALATSLGRGAAIARSSHDYSEGGILGTYYSGQLLTLATRRSNAIMIFNPSDIGRCLKCAQSAVVFEMRWQERPGGCARDVRGGRRQACSGAANRQPQFSAGFTPPWKIQHQPTVRSKQNCGVSL